MAAFEVVIKSQGGEGDEGLEVGVTTTAPEAADMNRSDYCASTVFPNWISSDSAPHAAHAPHQLPRSAALRRSPAPLAPTCRAAHAPT